MYLLGKQIVFKMEALELVFGDFREKRRFILCCDKAFSYQKYRIQTSAEKENRFLLHRWKDYSASNMF